MGADIEYRHLDPPGPKCEICRHPQPGYALLHYRDCPVVMKWLHDERQIQDRINKLLNCHDAKEKDI